MPLFLKPTLKPLFDHYTNVGNVGSGEDDLYSDTLVAGQLANNGDKIEAVYTASIAAATFPEFTRLKIYFGGTLIYNFSNAANATTITVPVSIIRVSSSVVRCSASVFAAGTTYTEVTGLTLANTQILKVTGQSDKATPVTDDVVVRFGYVTYIPAA